VPASARVVQVAAVDEERTPKQLPHPIEVRVPIDQPLGHDQQRIGAVRGAVGVGGVHHVVAEDGPRRVGGLGVVGLHPRSRFEQAFDERDRGALAHVVGLGLERQAPEADHFAGEVPAQILERLLQNDQLLLLVDLLDGLQHVERKSHRIGGVDDRLHVLGKAGATVARAGIEKGAADPLVRTDAQAHVLDVRPDQLAEAGHLIHEGDPGRQHGVGGVLGHLG